MPFQGMKTKFHCGTDNRDSLLYELMAYDEREVNRDLGTCERER